MFDLRLAEDRVEAAFPGRLHLRSSLTNPFTIYVQEKVGSSLESIAANLKDKDIRQAMGRADARRSAAECLATTMVLSKTNRIPCAKCGETIHLAINENRTTKCGCGWETKYTHWPSIDDLIQHLKMCDPLSGRDQLHRVRKIDQQKQFDEYHTDRMLGNDVGYAYKDALIEQIPAARLSGKTQMWVEE